MNNKDSIYKKNTHFATYVAMPQFNLNLDSKYEGEDRGKGDREKGGGRKEKKGGRKEIKGENEETKPEVPRSL